MEPQTAGLIYRSCQEYSAAMCKKLVVEDTQNTTSDLYELIALPKNQQLYLNNY